MGWHDAEDDLDDREFPDQDDDEGDEAVTVPCPHCRESVYEDAERCPSCGRYLSREEQPWRRPWWLLIGVIACLWAVWRGMFGLGF